MTKLRRLCLVGALAQSAFLFAQTLPEPRKQFGASLTGAFEGWYEDGSGARGFLVGYYNRNTHFFKECEVLLQVGLQGFY